jgi:hypothetical protein
MKVTITVEAADELVARFVDAVERLAAAEPRLRLDLKPEPRRFEDVRPARAILSPTPHRFR